MARREHRGVSEFPTPRAASSSMCLVAGLLAICRAFTVATINRFVADPSFCFKYLLCGPFKTKGSLGSDA